MKKDIGLAILRMSSGLTMFLAHGLGKLQGFSAHAANFPDPLGVGSTASMALAIFSEALCALALVIGFKTRWASVPLLITMLVAALVHHGADPFPKKEKALLYGIIFLVLIFTGGGHFSIDGMRSQKSN